MLDTEKKIGIRIEIKKGFKGLLEAIFFFSLQFFVIIQNLTISFVTGWFAGGLLFTCCWLGVIFESLEGIKGS